MIVNIKLILLFYGIYLYTLSKYVTYNGRTYKYCLFFPVIIFCFSKVRLKIEFCYYLLSLINVFVVLVVMIIFFVFQVR